MPETIELKYRYFGGEGNPPLVILHGLLGHSRNWQTAAKALAADFEVFALDLRNHGDSPHDSRHDYPALMADVVAWLAGQQLGPVWLLGHSMGGKTAMRLACQHPELLKALVVVDISPVQNPPYNAVAFAAMAALDVANLERREDADAVFQRYGLKDAAFRQFLLASLVRVPDGGYRWRHNLDVLINSMGELSASPLDEGMVYAGPALFLRGEQSPFVEDRHAPVIEKHFPNYILSTVSQAGHNVHMENLAGMQSTLKLFKQRVEPATG